MYYVFPRLALSLLCLLRVQLHKAMAMSYVALVTLSSLLLLSSGELPVRPGQKKTRGFSQHVNTYVLRCHVPSYYRSSRFEYLLMCCADYTHV